jgi:hypothetical protein
MSKRYIVLDQNVLRNPLLINEITTESKTHFVLPDLAFLEMTKSSEWEQTVHRSLQILSNVPSRVHVTYSVNEALDDELSTLRPVTGRMLHHKATEFVRDLLNSVSSGVEGTTLALMRRKSPENVANLSAQHLDHAENKKRFSELIETTKSCVGIDLQQKLRRGEMTEIEKLEMVHHFSVNLFPKVLQDRGVNVGRARMFMKRRPMALRYYFLNIWYLFHWIEKGGFDCIKAEKITNDEVDRQYILTASFFHGLLSLEARVNDAYKALTAMLEMKI